MINVKPPSIAMQANKIISETTFTKKQYLDDHVLMVHKGINPYVCRFLCQSIHSGSYDENSHEKQNLSKKIVETFTIFLFFQAST